MLGLILLLFEAQQVRARDRRDGYPTREDDHRRGLAMRSGFACCNWPPKSLLDDAPDKVTHSYTAQSGAGLERAVEILRKVNGGPHISIFYIFMY
jgi:hypothetical protein